MQCSHHNNDGFTHQRICLHALTDFKTRHLGHHHIEQNKIGSFRFNFRHRFDTVVSQNHLAWKAFHICLNQLEILFVIVNDQNFAFGKVDVGVDMRRRFNFCMILCIHSHILRHMPSLANHSSVGFNGLGRRSHVPPIRSDAVHCVRVHLRFDDGNSSLVHK